MQRLYPVPSEVTRLRHPAGQDARSFRRAIRAEFEAFLAEHAQDLAVLMVEPQWGMLCGSDAVGAGYVARFCADGAG
jgi:hypothetical protein